MLFEKPILYTAKPSDASFLSKFAEKTFREAFAKLNKKQDFEKYVAESFTENKIKSEISDRESFFYIAKLKNQWVGYAKLCQSHHLNVFDHYQQLSFAGFILCSNIGATVSALL